MSKPEQVYVARRPFSSHRHNGMERKGNIMPKDTFSPKTAQELQRKGLIAPTYKTKEDKRAAKVQIKEKVTIERDESQWYFLKKGDEVIDRVWQKHRAQEAADELNES